MDFRLPDVQDSEKRFHFDAFNDNTKAWLLISSPTQGSSGGSCDSAVTNATQQRQQQEIERMNILENIQFDKILHSDDSDTIYENLGDTITNTCTVNGRYQRALIITWDINNNVTTTTTIIIIIIIVMILN